MIRWSRMHTNDSARNNQGPQSTPQPRSREYGWGLLRKRQIDVLAYSGSRSVRDDPRVGQEGGLNVGLPGSERVVQDRLAAVVQPEDLERLRRTRVDEANRRGRVARYGFEVAFVAAGLRRELLDLPLLEEFQTGERRSVESAHDKDASVGQQFGRVTITPDMEIRRSHEGI